MILRAIIKLLILPPAFNILLILFGLFVWRYYKKIGQSIVLFSVILLWCLSTPMMSQALVKGLEDDYAPLKLDEHKTSLKDNRLLPPSQTNTAIVVLGGGRYKSAPEYGRKDTVSVMSLNRLRYTAKLAKTLEFPILTTGGVVYSHSSFMQPPAESYLMKEVLENDFGVPVKWVEDQSKTTKENAKNSVLMLQEAGVETIFLVTHANHMPRAVSLFQKEVEALENYTIKIIPAPMGYFSVDDSPNVLLSLLPKASALQLSRVALHEWLGRLYYLLFS